MLTMFKDFLSDEEAEDMYVTGAAGTGKTHGLAVAVEYCIANEIDYTVCAYTHKACGVLRSKLPEGANVRTLHSFLKKRPTINLEAQTHQKIEVSRRHGASGQTKILFIDEYSIVGERDLMDIRDVCSSTEQPPKIVWLGDSHQLPPVGDMQSVNPYGDYQLTLTKRWRTGDDSPLQKPLDQLISYIEGASPKEGLQENEKLIRGCDIVGAYKEHRNGVMLAFTNRKVQDLNAEVQGYENPREHDAIFCPSNRLHLTFIGEVYPVTEITKPFGDDFLELGSKYRTLEYLLRQDYKFCRVIDDEGLAFNFCYIFGHQAYNEKKNELKQAAADSNLAIGKDAVQWARANPETAKAKARAKAWRAFLAFNECVVCLDFPHAMTVHKSQGSTYHTVYVDTQDLAIAADINYMLYLKLMYVALSRASDTVITN